MRYAAVKTLKVAVVTAGLFLAARRLWRLWNASRKSPDTVEEASLTPPGLRSSLNSRHLSTTLLEKVSRLSQDWSGRPPYCAPVNDLTVD